ncbi:MAG: hypothetical protein M1816_003968 [Peltula sp. TS41687]|nr:MAG: hypothetical protein M1816_003968 [Peltula sp. TS41687]
MTSNADLTTSINLPQILPPVHSTPSSTPHPAINLSYEPNAPHISDPAPVVSPAPHSFDSSRDIEAQIPPGYAPEDDPYHLAPYIKSASEIQSITNDIRKHDILIPGKRRTMAKQAKGLASFYESQNEHIERLLRPIDEHRRLAKEAHSADSLRFKIATQGSLWANVILAALQLAGAATAGSLSLYTTMADSIFDPLSNLMLFISHRTINRVDARRFPSGKARIETAANISFCFLMCSVSVVLIVSSIRELAQGPAQPKRLYAQSIAAVVISMVVKFLLFLYCSTLRNKYSQVWVLWEDHRNDLFINGLGLVTSVGGTRWGAWIDPAGAIFLSLIIAALWIHTACSEFLMLIGVTADTQLHQLITYISMTHSPRITGIDTVRAYHSGPRIIVEVDVVMDEDETLHAIHDIAEALQIKPEGLPDVERAYVHVDYETTHKPEHFVKKEL